MATWMNLQRHTLNNKPIRKDSVLCNSVYKSFFKKLLNREHPMMAMG